MIDLIKTFVVSFIVFLGIDLLWLGVVAKNLYRSQLGYLMKTNFNMVAAMIFYVIFVIGLIVFVIHPALGKESWQYALLMGLFFGFVTYATYDLTNLATIKDWPLFITLVDLAWGTTLGGTTAVISYLILNKIL